MPLVHSLQLIGVAGIASYAVARVVHRMGLVDYQRARLIAIPTSAMPAMPRGFCVAPVAPEWLAAQPIDIPPADQARRFAGGATCLAAHNARDEFVGVTWVATGRFDDDGMAVRYILPPDAGWDTGLWIAPEHRMGRAFAALWAGTAAWLQARGAKRSFSKILDYNTASLRAHERLSPVSHGHFIMARIGDRQLTTRTRPRLARIGGAPAELDLSAL